MPISRIGSAAHAVSTGGNATRRLPRIAHTSLHGRLPSPATLKTPGTSCVVAYMRRADDVVVVHELHARVEAEDLGDDAAPSACANGVSRSLPNTLANRSSVTPDVRVVVGEVAQERLDLEQRALDRGARRTGARHVFAELVRVLEVGAVHERRSLHDDLPYRAPGRPAAARRFMVPITLISCRVRPVARVESTMRCECTTVSISVARTMRERIEYERVGRTNSVRSSGTRGSRVSSPTMTSTSGRCSSACATRPPSRCSDR